MAKVHAGLDGVVGRFGLHVHLADTGLDEASALQQMLHIISDENILVCIGEVLARVTEPLHYILKSSMVSQASPVSSSMTLSNRKEFPFYWRTVPNDVTLFNALVATMKAQFSWKNVAVLSSGDEESSVSASTFTEICNGNGVAVVQAKGLQNLNITNIEGALTQIKDTGARVIFAALSVDAVAPVFDAASRLGMTSASSGFVWILNAQAAVLDVIDPATAALIPEGTISVGPAVGTGAQYQRYLNATRTWSATPILSAAYVYDTALTMMRTVKSIDDRGNDYYNRTALYAAIGKIDFVGATGRVAFAGGDRLYAEVSVVRRTSGKWEEFVRTSFGASTSLIANRTVVKPYVFADPSISALKDLSLNYMRWQDGAGLALVLIASLALLCILGSALLVFIWRHNVMVRASSPAFLQVLLSGTIIAILSIFPSTGELTDAACTVRTWLFILGFVMAYGACLLKNWRVYRLWSDQSMRIIRISNLHLLGYSLIFLVPFLLLLIVWTAVDKPFANIRGANLVCEQGKTIVWPLLEFIGIGLMLVAGVVLAFMTRAIPQLYNECKHIALASYNMTFCLVIGIALSFILQPISITAAYICYCVGVLFAFVGLWAIVLGPKLYLMIFRPDKLAGLSSGQSSSRSAKALSTASSVNSNSKVGSSKKSSAKEGRGSSGRRSSHKSSGAKFSNPPSKVISTKSEMPEDSDDTSSHRSSSSSEKKKKVEEKHADSSSSSDEESEQDSS